MKNIFGLCAKIKSAQNFLTAEFRSKYEDSADFSGRTAKLLATFEEHLINAEQQQRLSSILSETQNYKQSSAAARKRIFKDIVFYIIQVTDEIMAQPVEYVKGVGPKIAQTLKKLNLETVGDIIYYFPRTYEDRRQVSGLGTISDNMDFATVRLSIADIKIKKSNYYRRGGRSKSVVNAKLSDGRNSAYAKWFNQPYIYDNFKIGDDVIISGKIKREFGVIIFDSNPLIESIDAGSINVERIVPIYPLTQGMNQRFIRKIIYNVVSNVAPILYEYLPNAIKSRYNMIKLSDAIQLIHFPDNVKSFNYLFSEMWPPKFRLKFDEFFLMQIALLMRRHNVEEQQPALKIAPDKKVFEIFENILPFKFTNAQRRAAMDIFNDMSSGKIMNRLICGDVGSGKTVVALAGVWLAKHYGGQCAMMVPTEILAQQHYNTAVELFGGNMNIALLTGSTKTAQKKAVYEGLANGSIDFVIGTHSLINANLKFQNLAFIITDEQHRFGVKQRALLKDKGNAHILVMSATPIPRTLAMTVYGDLAVSTIDELPPGRRDIRTYLYRDTQRDRERVYRIILSEIKKGHQAYVVYPLLNESASEMLEDIKDATSMAQQLKEIFNDYNVALIHGKLSGDDKKKIISEFKSKNIQILVSTTVIEVGIDVPDASLIVIEHADRFGLSQLHQLRGRIGRGTIDSFCLAIASKRVSAEAYHRLKIFEHTSDGFEIAERDLELRGPGEFLGSRQHGLPEFRIANIVRDVKILVMARKEAQKLVEQGVPDVLKYYAENRYGKKIDLGDVS